MSEQRKRCYTSGDEIKLLSEIQELDKPEFIELSDEDLMSMFKDLIVINEENELEPEPIEMKSSLNYGIYDEQWYAEKFPGFPDETYHLMVIAAKEENDARDLNTDTIDPRTTHI
jgi:hypothetical protein